MLKGYLVEKGVSFAERLTDADPLAHEEMLKVSDGAMGVPFAVFEKDDGTVVKILGFDKEKVDAALGLS
ncbi:MAG: hypothetical protein A2700_01165 [Candidatus Blackburnbacteria bacterium RIFCSPHIGHO2_01_FULL_44_64]|uniref:Glutaredoxin domain-containing protein n=1 Tax=Candidatus Blackburnbacteria bacterium RIFCSPHIGHO2_02_FULL_44_20 TaxID=1797516 RepID=A0A1G1V8C8_9BACT|nr:MAG: hypothetical protein A2700_01165 [Candidatus Blackburnbacteria bacterium RIFCSPHIGHO2_01_FULL_44_64]OGY11594.1 MAG: hypothetical protein A3E16_04540 [Candidatus Blackburnbacteria bacterium RIFCSPHIGHO2_12_FULL_44_25]OGY11685.1 MAG: hypothetical protein A3D26_01055 [Candidatus Blackburnbacteria bacterium RIFCSPHIGHO2_02_FULL_44_20]OGY14389.1 MAG: hypothetical protein A3A62_03510 [Candidatus Blackburnbacteria bacterium RIFCSPLOWO2_01_FULL_44_43]OGY17410.1 MAG: hypothetical protein A3H88_0